MNTERFSDALELRDSGRIEEALLVLRELLQSTSDPLEQSSIMLNEVTCLMTLGKLGEARQVLDSLPSLEETSAIALSASFVDACLTIDEGRARGGMNKLRRFLKVHEATLQQPDNQELCNRAALRLGYELVKLGKIQEALAQLERILVEPLTSEDRQLLELFKGIAYYNLGDYYRARAAFELAAGFEGDTTTLAQIRYRLSETYSRLGAHARAREEIEWCIENVRDSSIPQEYLREALKRCQKKLENT